ncbi:MAG: putative bifunctional diguanylate cyclase/phosphodiesterase [Salinibacter sp.]
MSAPTAWEAFEEALTLAEVGAWAWDPDSGDVQWSDHLYDLLGTDPDGAPPSLDGLIECLHADDRDRIRRAIQDVSAQNAATEVEGRYVSQNTEGIRWMRMKIVPETDDTTPVQRVVGTVRDITSRKHAKAEQEETRRQLDLLHEVSPLALMTSTPEGTVHGVNQSFEETFGRSAEATEGSSVGDLNIWVVPEHREMILDRLDGESPVSAFESRLRTESGEVREVELSVGKIQRRGRPFLLWAIRDVSERNRLQRQLRGQAFFDSVTGLPTRDLLIDRADHAIRRADRSDWPLTLLYVDIDDFKAINEELGHPAGDELLAQVAKRLKRSVRSSDTVARPEPTSDTVTRIAGDEFALLLEGSGEDESKMVAERLQKLFKTPFEVAGTTVHLSVSFGLAVREPEDENLTEGRDLLRTGETAIYAARQDHEQIHVIGPDDERRAGRLRRREELQRALRWNEFELYYQPIIDLRDRSVGAAEALVRWRHPEQGLVTPSEFIPLAEESGLIEDVDQWVLQRAVQQVAAWREDGCGPSRMSVNVTARKHSNEEAQRHVLQLLDEHDLPGEAITLETTERIAFRHAHPFEALRQAGVQLAIDDFGTGYSALFYLHRFDADALKIDRGFIDGLNTDRQMDILVRAMLDIADHLDMASIAEGVETEAQLSRLRELGCHFAQGYLFARPMPAEAFEEFFDEEAPVPSF